MVFVKFYQARRFAFAARVPETWSDQNLTVPEAFQRVVHIPVD